MDKITQKNTFCCTHYVHARQPAALDNMGKNTSMLSKSNLVMCNCCSYHKGHSKAVAVREVPKPQTQYSLNVDELKKELSLKHMLFQKHHVQLGKVIG